MKIVSYTALHYGSDYLYYAIKSVIDHVDEHWIIYSDVGSHGSRTAARCPDTREELMDIAVRAAGEKLGWIDGQWARETDQRSMIHELAPDADVILVVDSDEVYQDGLAKEAIDFALHTGVRTVRVPFIHLWRSFRRGFAHDPAYPIRVINPKAPDGAVTMPTDKRVWHFGYCGREEIVAYKFRNVHGHKAEWRKDCDWLNDVFLANRQYDCHPIGSEFWTCEDIDLSNIPSVLLDHPYYNLEVVR